jgi:catechol 2,3-dioxygenase-like lactoylglutathione lyase family enzyme
MQSVRSIEATRDFYERVLGFVRLAGGDFVNPVAAPNNFGVPGNLVVAHPLRFGIFAPVEGSPTPIECVEFVGVSGRDLAERAVPPNLGIMSLRYPVSDARQKAAELTSRGAELFLPVRESRIEPYGRVRAFAVRSPDGAVLEFFQILDPDGP